MLTDKTIILGNKFLVPGSYGVTWKNGSGGQTTLNYEGPYNLAIQEANLLQSTGWDTNLQVNQKGSMATLTATINFDVTKNNAVAQDALPQPQWEVTTQTGQINLLESDVPIIKGLSSLTKECIQYRLKHPTSNSPLFVSGSSAQTMNNATIVYQLMQLGKDTHTVKSQTIKRIVTVNNSYRTNWSTANDSVVLSRDKLIQYAQVPYWIQQIMQDSNPRLLPMDTVSGITDPNYYKFYGYLQHPGDYANVGGNRVQVSQQWSFGAWPTIDNPFIA